MFADNTQISHRQFFRQTVLSLLGIYFLAVPVTPGLSGIQGILSLIFGLVFYCLLCIYFIRIKNVFQNPQRYMGKIAGRIFVFLYLSWLWMMGVYLLLIIAGITARFLIEGSISWAVILAAGLTSYLGSHQGLEGRGRMAEVCFPIVITLLVGMLLLVWPDMKPSYLMEKGDLSFRGLAWGTTQVLGLFLPFTFFPVTLGNVKKAGETGRIMAGAMVLLAGISGISLLLLQGCFGTGGYEHKKYPMIDMLAGARVSGDFLGRVDTFWTAAVLFSLFFSLGSVFFYNHELLRRTGQEKTAVLWAAGILTAAEICEKQQILPEKFMEITVRVYLPLLLILLLYAGFSGKKKRVFMKSVPILLCTVFLSGCGVSLEDRIFPLSVSADYREGKYEIIYGIPGLTQTTGQEKTKTQGDREQAVPYRGEKPERAEGKFAENQEKYLDMGHVRVLILGEGIVQNRKALEELLDYLEDKPSVGANQYVFVCKDVNALMNLNKREPVGEYLCGILENHPERKKKRAVTLQDLYNARHRKEELPDFLEVTIVNEKPRIRQYS